MSRFLYKLFLTLVGVMFAAGAAGQASGPDFLRGFGATAPEPVRVEAHAWPSEVSPGGTAAVAVILDIAEGYHINPDPARSGPAWFEGQYPTTLRVVDPAAGLSIGPVQFPEPHPYAVEYAEQEILVYDGRVVLFLPLVLSDEVPLGELTLDLELEYQACDPKVCLIPITVTLPVQMTVVPLGEARTAAEQPLVFADFDPSGWAAAVEYEADAAADPQDRDDPAAGLADGGSTSAAAVVGEKPLGWVLLVTLAAGLLLNFTPCVLPVVPLKVMSLAKHGEAAGGRRRTIVLAVAMAVGIVGFWLAIALAITSLKQFQTINQLFQYPSFNLAVGVLIGVLAVSMMGLFTINLPRAVYQINPTGDTLPGSFAFGIMTAVLATPCAGPLMAGYVAWGTQQGTATVLTVFAALGLGMALPYLLLTLFPKLIDKLPRAGEGSELLKQTMGILMLAAAVFFLGVGIVALSSDGTRGTSQWYWWPVGLLVAAAGVWLIWRGLGRAATTPTGRGLVTAVGLLLVAAGAWAGLENGSWSSADSGGEQADADAEAIPWVYYTPERLAEARAAGLPVVLDFTADWCLNCKALEKAVLESERVRPLLQSPEVVAMKVDITSRNNVAGNALLREKGRITIPLLVVLDNEGEEVFKADFYTITQVVEAIGRVRSREVSGIDMTPHLGQNVASAP
jgi:thiol:disulfide interchange protein DsbD